MHKNSPFTKVLVMVWECVLLGQGSLSWCYALY